MKSQEWKPLRNILISINMISIHFYSWKGLISQLIKWRTHSKYSHVAISIDNHFYEAQALKWVVKSPCGLTRGHRENICIETTAEQERSMKEFLELQLGKCYDYRLIWSMIENKDWDDRDKWICSELVQRTLEFWILRKAKPYTPWELFLILNQMFGK